MVSSTTLSRAAARTRRIDLRVVVGLLLFVIGVLATSSVIRQAKERTPVLVASRALEPGSKLVTSDVRVAELGLASGVASIGADRLDSVVGATVSTPVAPGQVLTPYEITSGPPLSTGQVAMALSLTPAHAAGGALAPGDRVMVLATGDPNSSSGKTVVLLPSVEVISMGRSHAVGTDAGLTVTLAPSSNDAPGLAHAVNSGVVDLALLPSGSSP